MELGLKTYENMFFFYKGLLFLRCAVWDGKVEQNGALPPSEISIGSKQSAQIPNKIHYSYIFLQFYVHVFFSIIDEDITHIWATIIVPQYHKCMLLL